MNFREPNITSSSATCNQMPSGVWDNKNTFENLMAKIFNFMKTINLKFKTVKNSKLWKKKKSTIQNVTIKYLKTSKDKIFKADNNDAFCKE